MVANATWYVCNTHLLRDPRMGTIDEEIKRFAKKREDRLKHLPNELLTHLLQPMTLKRLEKLKGKNC